MFCQNCGTKIADGVNTCPNCNHVNPAPGQAARPHNRAVVGQTRNKSAQMRARQRKYMQFLTTTYIESHLEKAIFSALFCLPLGIIAIIVACQVSNKLKHGDVLGAKKFSEIADKLSNISIICSFLVIFIIIRIAIKLSIRLS